MFKNIVMSRGIPSDILLEINELLYSIFFFYLYTYILLVFIYLYAAHCLTFFLYYITLVFYYVLSLFLFGYCFVFHGIVRNYCPIFK